jgi:hypothetical protein
LLPRGRVAELARQQEKQQHDGAALAAVQQAS